MAATDPNLAIDLRDAAKTYRRKVHALRGVSMQVHRGEIFGLLGPNGAGKSTLVKMLMTVIKPTRCEGSMLGHRIGHKPTLAKVGYLPEHHKFPDYLTARQTLEFYGALSGVDRATRRRRAAELLDLVGLRKVETSKVRTFSKGMRQRLGVAQSLLHEPDLILLDEPTDGVDPEGRREIRNILMEQRRLGRAVMVNSHLLSELEMVCDRAAILVNGLVWAQGTINELTSYDLRYVVQVSSGNGAVDPAVLSTLVAGLGPLAATANVDATAGTLSVATGDPAAVQPLIDGARRAGLMIRAVTPIRPTLEDLFMRAVLEGRRKGESSHGVNPARGAAHT